MRITGRTRILAHVGWPTEGFRSPMIYNPWFEASGTDVVTVPMGVGPDDLESVLRALSRLRNFAGALVTMPHKVAVVGLLDEASPAVRACGACNAVRAEGGRLIGDMFDGAGFVRGAARKGFGVTGSSALVVGAGGVGSAIAAALAGAGAARVIVSDILPERAGALAARLAAHFPGTRIAAGVPDPSGMDMVVNATPLGLRDDDPLPLDISHLRPGGFVGEVALRSDDTPLVAAARARGCTVQVGTDMLFEQIPAYLEFFGLPVASPDRLRALARLEG